MRAVSCSLAVVSLCLLTNACTASGDADDATASVSGGSAGSAGSNDTASGSAGVSGAAGLSGAAGASGAVGVSGAAGASPHGDDAGSAGGGRSGTGGSGGSEGGAEAGVSAKCDQPAGPGLPGGAPALQVGTWVNISPAGVAFNAGSDPIFTQGMAVDPCNPAVLYLAVSAFDISHGGLFKSINAGGSWTRVGKVDGYASAQLDEPIRIRIDPKNTQHIYVGDGVRGNTLGFFVSTDGGISFKMPQGFANAYKLIELSSPSGMYDVYDVAVDPTDFSHVLLSFHSPFDWNRFDAGAGILETKDEGNTWVVHGYPKNIGQGHAIHFLYQPELGIGDSKTWLWGTQAAGMQRTTDSGQTWTEVNTESIAHGGGTVYYTPEGVLYASGNEHSNRSTDNGASWTSLNSPGGTAIFGDGKKLYTARVAGDHFMVSSESDGLTWTNFNDQVFIGGPFEMALDTTNHILYSASWNAGIWALKLP